MEEIDKYNWVLIKKESGEYIGWSKAKEKPHCGEPDKLEWVKWNKELPEMVDPETGEEIKFKYNKKTKKLTKDTKK